MNLIISGRAGGKSRFVHEWLLGNPNRVVICFNQEEAQRMWMDHYLDWSTNIKEDQFITPTEFLQKRYQYRNQEVVVDNVDIVLKELFGPVEAMTATDLVIKGPGYYPEDH